MRATPGAPPGLVSLFFLSTCRIYEVTDDAWTWIDSNDSLFSLFREEKAVPELTEDDIPF